MSHARWAPSSRVDVRLSRFHTHARRVSAGRESSKAREKDAGTSRRCLLLVASHSSAMRMKNVGVATCASTALTIRCGIPQKSDAPRARLAEHVGPPELGRQAAKLFLILQTTTQNDVFLPPLAPRERERERRTPAIAPSPPTDTTQSRHQREHPTKSLSGRSPSFTTSRESRSARSAGARARECGRVALKQSRTRRFRSNAASSIRSSMRSSA